MAEPVTSARRSSHHALADPKALTHTPNPLTLGHHLARLLPAPIHLSHAQRALPWRALIFQAAGVWLATRLAYLTLTGFFPLVSSGATTANAISTTPVSVAALIRRWAQWDGGAFVSIAQHGYTTAQLTAYFPLYPGAIRLTALLIGPHWATAALLVSNLGALLAFIGVALLAAQVAPEGEGRQVARVAVLLFAAYPLAFFLFAAYSDGLFAGLIVFALLFSLRRRWGWAACFGLLAGLCRPTAPALLAPLLWEAFQAYREARGASTPRQALRAAAPALAAIAAPLIGIGTYGAYLWLRFGDPLTFVTAERSWAHFSLAPLLSIPVAILAFAHIPLGSPLQARVLLDLAPVLGGVILTLAAARRAPVAFTLYMLSLLVLLTSEPLNYLDLFVSGGRYMLAAVPLFIIVAGWLKRSEWILPALCWSGALLQAMLAIFFLAHGWIV